VGSIILNHMITNTDLASRLDLPTLLQDIFNKADRWGNDGKSGRTDPFTDVYDVSLITAYVFRIGVEFVLFSSFSS